MAYQMLQTNTMEQVLETNLNQNGNQQDQDFFLDDKDVPKKTKRQQRNKTPYSSTKMKARNFLTNISYRRISDKDFKNVNFIIDMLSYILLYVKPFFLQLSYSDKEQRNMVKMLWEKCLPTKFYEHVKKPANFFILNSGKLTFNQAKNIVLSYIQLPDTWKELTEIITKRQEVYQYVFATVFPTTYLQINKYGIKIRNDFSLCFTEWLNENIKKEQLKQLGKTAANYTNNSNNEKRHPYEQKPIKNDNKENIPPSESYKHFPTMAKINFDKKYALPTVKRKTYKTKNGERQNKKEELMVRLSEIDEKMKLIKSK